MIELDIKLVYANTPEVKRVHSKDESDIARSLSKRAILLVLQKISTSEEAKAFLQKPS
jgi:hypothetical protein